MKTEDIQEYLENLTSNINTDYFFLVEGIKQNDYISLQTQK